MKAVNNTFAMLFQTLMEIINAFCYMDVISNAFRFQLIAESHCLIRDCKGCMHTHHSGDHITVVCKCMFNKIHVLHYRFSGFLHSVTIRNLIAEAGTHTQILRSFLDRIEGTCNMTEARMVVKHCSYTILDRINVCSICRKLCLLQCQMTVNCPP